MFYVLYPFVTNWLTLRHTLSRDWALTLVPTNNYDSLTELHNSKITVTAPHSVFTSRCLVAAFNGGRFHSPGFSNCPRPQLPASHSLQQQLSTESTTTQSHSQSQSYFTADGLPPISSSWRQAS
jgi:hypothetical protein